MYSLEKPGRMASSVKGQHGQITDGASDCVKTIRSPDTEDTSQMDYTVLPTFDEV